MVKRWFPFGGFFGRGGGEAKSLSAPGPDLFALFGVVPSASGVMISADAALRVPAVGSAIRVISEAAACLERKAEPVAAVVLSPGARVNAWTSAFELVRDLVIDALTTDKGGLAWVSRNGAGEVLELVHYTSGAWSVDYEPATREPTYRIGDRVVSVADVVHLRAPFGRAPLSLYREAIAVALTLEGHAAELFGNGAMPKGALQFPKGMGEEATKKARAKWIETHNATGRTAILFDGAEYKPFTFASTDAQFLENRTFQILEVARAFRVPPSMLFELSRATWGNTEQMGQEFLVYCLEPWLQLLEGAFARAGLPFTFDRDDMTRADLATRANTVNSLIAAKVLNANEGRGWFGYGPRPGGDLYENPNVATDAPAPEPEGGGDAA